MRTNIALLFAAAAASMIGSAAALPAPPQKTLKAIAIPVDGPEVLMTIMKDPKSAKKGWQLPRGKYEEDIDLGDLGATALRETGEETANWSGETNYEAGNHVYEDKDNQYHTYIVNMDKNAPAKESPDSLTRSRKWFHHEEVDALLKRPEMKASWAWAKPRLYGNGASGSGHM